MEKQIKITSEWDRVIFSISSLDVQLPYASALQIAQHLRLAAKHAMAISGEVLVDWRTVEDAPSTAVMNETHRKRLAGKFNWQIDVDSETVLLVLGNYTIALHFMDALQVSKKMTIIAKEAKVWAGDSSKQLLASGFLSDAEANYNRKVRML